MTSNNSYGSHYGRSKSSKKDPIGKSTIGFLVNHDKGKGKFVHQQQNIAQRSRHGLFTQPMPLTTGDNYEDKKPDEVAKNVSVNQRFVKKVGPQLFEQMASTNIGDPYKDKFRAGQLYAKQKNQLSIHQRAFGAGGKQKLVKHSEFQHKQDYDHKVYDTKDEQGRVKTGLKNIYSSNMKKGFGNTTTGHLFSSYKYQGSPYDNAKQIQTNIHAPFSGASNPNATFTPNYVDYHNVGEPYQEKNDDLQYRSKTTKKWAYNNANKKGFYGTFTQFPKHIEQGEKPKQQIKHENTWRPNFNGTSKGFGQTLARPCPVPSQMVLNNVRSFK